MVCSKLVTQQIIKLKQVVHENSTEQKRCKEITRVYLQLTRQPTDWLHPERSAAQTKRCTAPMADTICGSFCNFKVEFIRSVGSLGFDIYWRLKVIVVLYCVRLTYCHKFFSSCGSSLAILMHLPVTRYVNLVTFNRLLILTVQTVCGTLWVMLSVQLWCMSGLYKTWLPWLISFDLIGHRRFCFLRTNCVTTLIFCEISFLSL